MEVRRTEREKMKLIRRVLRTLILIVLGAVLGTLLGVLVLQIAFAATGRSAGNANVAIAGFAYSPKQAVVRVGDTVTWTNNDFAPHTVTANDASFNSGTLGQGGVYSRTFGATGVFSYFCAIHPSMTGSVRVISETLVHLPLVQKAGQASAPAPPDPPVVGASGRWSDSATWGGQVPEPTSEITIPAGKTVILESALKNRMILD
ncbi:MAG: hypothetical protein KatS3mg053_2884 [Candidatus Roseilinea sp.]|nr:MAG: hypothetical protein KatS3mg053_2884 [Candidatus Roseilinea sp.]